jgi:serine/threonine protein kinase
MDDGYLMKCIFLLALQRKSQSNLYFFLYAGTTSYKAPELLCSKPIYSEASDVFAFAIVSWEMLTTFWSGKQVVS